MDADKTCTATFTVRTFSVTFSIQGSGTLGGNMNQTVNYGGSTSAITATADTGNQFVEWSINDGVNTTTSTDNPLTISNVTANLTVKATFISNANFTATPMSGEGPLAVAFTDTSTNSPTSWLWDFDDGTTSLQRNPTHLFLSAGDYDVTLTTTASGVLSHMTKTINVAASTTDPVQVDGSEWPTLQAAYDHAAEGSLIEIIALTFTEDLVCWKDINIIIKGGYDGSFTVNMWYTTIHGTLTISAGTVEVINLIIQ
jgi:PKD repeat protein